MTFRVRRMPVYTYVHTSTLGLEVARLSVHDPRLTIAERSFAFWHPLLRLPVKESNVLSDVSFFVAALGCLGAEANRKTEPSTVECDIQSSVGLQQGSIKVRAAKFEIPMMPSGLLALHRWLDGYCKGSDSAVGPLRSTHPLKCFSTTSPCKQSSADLEAWWVQG